MATAAAKKTFLERQAIISNNAPALAPVKLPLPPEYTPTFAALQAATLGDYGTNKDGWDEIYNPLVGAEPSHTAQLHEMNSTLAGVAFTPGELAKTLFHPITLKIGALIPKGDALVKGYNEGVTGTTTPPGGGGGGGGGTTGGGGGGTTGGGGGCNDTIEAADPRQKSYAPTRPGPPPRPPKCDRATPRGAFAALIAMVPRAIHARWRGGNNAGTAGPEGNKPTSVPPAGSHGPGNTSTKTPAVQRGATRPLLPPVRR